jgi:hypothetical protein
VRVVTSLGRIELPDSWIDESVFQFASPMSKEVFDDAAARPVAASARRVVTFVRLRNAPPPADVLAQQLESLRAQIPRLVVHSQSAWKHPTYGDAPVLDCSHEVSPGRVTRQLHLVVCESPKCTACVTFSCDARAFDESLPEFQRLFASLELVAS